MKAVFQGGGGGQPQVTTDAQIGSDGMNVLTVHPCCLLDTQNNAQKQ